MKSSTLSVDQLAERLKDDIRRRRLGPRDKYLTSVEVGKAFRVSSVTAHRAMRMLAKDDILVRQRKVGTFVGEGALRHLGQQRGKIHFVISEALGKDPELVSKILPTDLLAGLLDVLEDVSIQVDFVQAAGAMSLVDSIVGTSTAEDYCTVDGAVLVGVSAAVQRRFAESGLPAVTFGGLHPGVTDLVSVDADQRRMGELTAEFVIGSGCRRATLCAHDVYMPGNDAYISGLLCGIQGSHKPIVIEHRSWPFEVDQIDQSLREMLSGNDRPELLIARNATVSRRIAQIVESMGLQVPRDLQIFVANAQEVSIRGAVLPGIQRTASTLECGRLLGQLLRAQQQREPIAPRRIVLPVALRKQQSSERERSANK